MASAPDKPPHNPALQYCYPGLVACPTKHNSGALNKATPPNIPQAGDTMQPGLAQTIGKQVEIPPPNSLKLPRQPT